MVYSKEPFDFKLFMLKMLGKWQWFLLCGIIGSLLFGCTYYMYKVVYAPAREYQASADYYIEYVKDPVLVEQSSYFNGATLDSWLTMDVFTDRVLPALSEELTVEELNSYVEMIMPSDVRVVKLQVMTSKPELTIEILQAYDEAFKVFGENQREIHRIVTQSIDEEATQIKADIRTQRAFVLGAVLGLVLGGLCIVLQYLLDDGIYLPATLRKRHGLTVFGSGEREELATNVKYAVEKLVKDVGEPGIGSRDKVRIAVTAVGDSPALPKVFAKLQQIVFEAEWVSVPSMVQCPEAGQVLRDCAGVILTVVSGKDKSGAIDRALAYYEQQDVRVLGAILWDADEKLLDMYNR